MAESKHLLLETGSAQGSTDSTGNTVPVSPHLETSLAKLTDVRINFVDTPHAAIHQKPGGVCGHQLVCHENLQPKV